jgi:hypothetical protein
VVMIDRAPQPRIHGLVGTQPPQIRLRLKAYEAFQFYSCIRVEEFGSQGMLFAGCYIVFIGR